MMLRRTILTVIAVFFCYLGFASTNHNFNVDRPLMRNDRFETDLPVSIEPGKPMMPYYDVRILLPGGHKFVSAEIEFGKEEILPDIYIDFASEPQPISIQQFSSTEANRAVYGSDSFYPEKSYEILGVQRKNGHDLLVINVYPYRYNPVRSELNWFDSFTVRIDSEYDNDLAAEQNLFLVQTDRVRHQISKLVSNPEQIYTYQKSALRNNSILADLNDPHQMIIISEDTKAPLFDDYIDFQASRNISAGFFTVEDIYLSYSGVDSQEKIRNFIIDAYQTYSQTDTPLEYVILGGDDNIIPIRGMYGQVGNYVDHNMPADIYYSNLDGNWDANNNGIYGELGDDIDWFAEVAIGRIPAYTDTQFQNFFNKTYHYVNNDTYSNDIVYMLGERLDNIPTWGGDYKDQIIPYIPQEYHIDTLYERDGTFSSIDVVNTINDGVGIINHIGHANYFIVFGLNNSRISNLQNIDYGFAYTQGCYPAAFDNATSEAAGAVGQNLVTAAGGLYAFIGNTRYGWYMPGSTDGPSQAYDITFFSGLYDHNIRELGHTMNYSKEALVNQAMNSGVMRWIYYQLVLFGDPSVAVKDHIGTFPYIEPVDVVFDDVMGDNDGAVNPGETINIYLELENLPGWSNAYNVEATISIDSDHITVINDMANFGDIATNGTSTNTAEPFVIEVGHNIPYDTYMISTEITAQGDYGAVFSKIYKLPVPVTIIQSHWPWVTPYPVFSSPLFADITGDGLEEILIVDVLGNINLLDDEANYVQAPIAIQENLHRSFSIGDITGDGNKEIVLASRSDKIIALNNLGELIFSYEDCGQQILTPVIADLNNDGNLQIISLGLNKNLYVLDSEGVIVPGFPLLLSHTSIADLAVADLNGDGFKEIIIGAIDDNLYVIRHDGTEHPGFPISLDSGIMTAPLVLDNKNIAVGTRERQMYLVSPQGDILFTLELTQRISTEIITADFTNNGELELAFVTNNGNVHIIDQTGEYLDGWPLSLNQSVLQSPLAVDLNGDNNVNLIVASSQGDVFAFNYDGSMVDSFPVPLNNSVSAPGSIADIDGDGNWDIIIPTLAGVYIIDYKFPLGQKTPWTVYRGNHHRTGYYGDNITSGAEIPEPEYITFLQQNYPNPFNPSTRIDFTLGDNSPVKLEIFNIKGQRVITLINEELTAGKQSILWNGVNSQNRIVGAGIYFYRLTSSDKTITRKMLLLK